MALTATLYTFAIDLSDHDRQVYDSLFVRAARHPSESPEFLWTRVLAFCAEYAEGIEFSRGGLSEPDEPALMVRDRTGAIVSWIEVGLPEAARLHRAMKAAPRVAVYVHRDPGQWLRRIAGERVHRVDALEVYAPDGGLIAGLAPRLERRVDLALSIADAEWHVSIGRDTLSGVRARLTLG